MANVNFGSFTTVTPQGNDFFVGFRNASETKTTISSLTSLNLPYASATNTLRSNSGRYEAVYNNVFTSVNPSTGLWNSTYTTVSSFSGLWAIQPNLTDIVAASSNWQEAYFQSVPSVSILKEQMALFVPVSGFWNTTTAIVFTYFLSWNNTTSGYESLVQNMRPLSSGWTSVYNTVNALSASYLLIGGNSTGSNISIGTNDNYSLTLESNNVTALTILSTGALQGGLNSIASGDFSHTEGNNNVASGNYSHAQNFNNIALGFASHVEGGTTRASGQFSHAGGVSAHAVHDRSWIWRGDSTVTGITSSTRADQFTVSAKGGVFIPGNVGIGTDNNTNALTIVGTVSATGALIVLANLPTSNTGLPSGALWNDSGTLKIV